MPPLQHLPQHRVFQIYLSETDRAVSGLVPQENGRSVCFLLAPLAVEA